MNECEPLSVECQRASWPMHKVVCAERGRGLHSSTSHLNLSRFCHQNSMDHPAYPTKGAYDEPKVDECKPLERGKHHAEHQAERDAHGLGSASRANRALRDWYLSAGSYTRPL